jgi:hypothetical protein
MNGCRVLAVALLLSLGACQTTTKKIDPFPPPLQTTVRVNGANTAGSTAPKTSDISFAPDSCASRLQDIEGTMIQFWLLNKQLPAHLEDLRSVLDPGQTLELTCAGSNEPFVYVRSGLRSLGRKSAIFVYSPTPARDGSYWCLLAEDPRVGSNWILDVQAVPPTLFRTYQLVNAGN